MTTLTNSVLVAGVPVDDVTMDEAVDLIVDLVADGRRRSVTHQVATVNVDFIVNALRDEALMRTLRATSLSVADGMPVVWGARLSGGRLRERVAGADLVPALVERAAREGLRVVLYGAGPGIAEQAAEILAGRAPGAVVVGDAGPDDVEQVSTIDELGAAITSGPDICCVAFGNPKQERFIERYGHQLGIPVMIGVGGTLDFIVGVKRRAPSWMHRTGLEWLHRALTEPRRLARRYWRDAWVFFPVLARSAWRGRRPGAARSRVRIAAGGAVDVDVSLGADIDNRVAAEIVGAVRSARRRGAEVRLTGDGTVVVVPGLLESIVDH